MMTSPSIRARLTAWYVGVLAVATLTLTGASWWLSSRSVVTAADISLQARIEGVRSFLENPRTRLTVEGLQDEFGEYAELTRGEALLEVIDGDGTVLVRPSIPGWAEAASRIKGAAASVAPIDETIGTLPFRIAFASMTASGRRYLVTVAAPMGPAYAALNRFHSWLIALLPAVLIVAGIGGYWISRRALMPVDEMTRAVEDITVQSLDHRLEVPQANDELRRLALTFNKVLARLHSAVGDIVRFTADASHELRTPVSLIRTTAELTLRHERTPSQYREAFGEVLQHAKHMSVLVNDLLVLARTDADIEPRGTTNVDLRALVDEVRHELRTIVDDGRAQLSVDLPPSPIVVEGDGAAIRRVLMIVLENAVKYSPVGGAISLRLHSTRQSEATMGVIEISDAGIGVDPSDLPRAFERFYRGSRAREHAPEGTGLGLAIAKKTVDRYQGAITLTAVPGSDAGCRVTVMFPAIDVPIDLDVIEKDQMLSPAH